MAAGVRGVIGTGERLSEFLRNGLRVCMREMGEERREEGNQRASYSRCISCGSAGVVRSRGSKLSWSEVTSKRWRGLAVRQRGFRRKAGRRIDKNSSKASVWRAERGRSGECLSAMSAMSA